MDEVLKKFAEGVTAEFPSLATIINQAKAGTISEADALRAMAEVLGSNPAMVTRFQEYAKNTLAPLRGDPLDHNGLVLHKQRGLPQLNPLVEAALIERAQFDGDIPELRTGDMPRGVKPAVSVETTVRDPAALGHMLNTASDQVGRKIAAQEPAKQKFIAQVAGGDTDALALLEQAGQALTVAEARDLVLDGKSDMMDVPEYRRGHVPAPVKVATPSGGVLLALTPQERKQGAWQFLSTTQGRRTAVAGLTELLEVKLRGEGFEVVTRPFTPGATEPVLAAHEWTVGIDGPGAMQAAFSLIDIAAAAITKGLASKAGERRGRVVLEVTAINTVDVRSVGWAGRLLTTDGMLEAPC